MNPHTGAVYPVDLDGIEDADRREELASQLADEDPDDLVRVEGQGESLAELIEAAQQRAESMGNARPDRGLSKRELRRMLDRA